MVLIVEIHCGSLVAPSQGSASGSSDTVGSVVMFSCDAGFRLKDSSQRTCQQNGNWDGEDATCDGQLVKIMTYPIVLIIQLFSVWRYKNVAFVWRRVIVECAVIDE